MGQAGFTLLELLIAVLLFAMIVAVVVGAIRLGSRTWAAGDRKIEAMAAVRLAQGLIRNRLSEAYPLIPKRAETPVVAFDGTAQAVTFIGFAPPELGLGGLYRMSFAEETGEDGKRLVMVQQRIEADRDGLHLFGKEERRVLEDGIARLRFAYFGAGDDHAPHWHDAWQGLGMLPLLVALRIEYAKGDARVWPALVVAPAITAEADCRFDRSTKRCLPGAG